MDVPKGKSKKAQSRSKEKITAVEKETKALLKEAYTSLGFSRKGIKRRLKFKKPLKKKTAGEEPSSGTSQADAEGTQEEELLLPDAKPLSSSSETPAPIVDQPTEDFDFDVNIANAQGDFQSSEGAEEACKEVKSESGGGEPAAEFASLIVNETNEDLDLSGDALVLDEAFWHQEGVEHLDDGPQAPSGGKKKKRQRSKQKSKQKKSKKVVESSNVSGVDSNEVVVKAVTEGEDEAKERYLDFNSEVEAVNAGVRAFVPELAVTPRQYRSQSSLLQSVREAADKKDRLDQAYQQKRLQRPVREKLEDACMKIQRVFRGHVGRIRAAQCRQNLAEELARKEDEQRAIDQAWTKVHDPATGDTWFYNEKTCQSQWEAPAVYAEKTAVDRPIEDLGDVAHVIADRSELDVTEAEAEDSIRSDGRERLPPLGASGRLLGVEQEVDQDGIPYNKSSLYPPSESSVSTPAESLTSDVEDLGPASSRSRISDGTMDSCATRTEDTSASLPQTEEPEVGGRSFFLPDGSTDVNLRDTIRMALTQNKFDSVSSLLASTAKNGSKSKGAAANMRSVPKEWSIRPKLVAPVKLPRGFRRKKQERVVLPKVAENSSRAKAKAKVKGGAPTIYQVAHPGLNAEEMRLDRVDRTDPIADRAFEDKDKDKNICFLCWSYGGDAVQKCDIHDTASGPVKNNNGLSVLTCANWTLTALERKYRSEDVEEIFARSNASVRWDATRRRFITVVEAKHAIYRNWNELAQAFNRKSRSKIRLQFWMRSILCALKLGMVKSEKGQRRASFMQARDALVNSQAIRRFKATVHLLEPKAPVTLTTSAYHSKKKRRVVLADEGYTVPDPESKGLRYITGPVSKPLALLKPYLLEDYLPPRYVRVPAPSVMFSRDSDGSDNGSAPNVYMDPLMPGSWLERMAAHLSTSVAAKALKEIRDQAPEVAKLRSKHARATTNKFATFFRSVHSDDEKRTRRDKGMPPARAILSQFVTTAVAAQYGKFVVTAKATLAPERNKYTYSDITGEDGYIDRKKIFRTADPKEHVVIGDPFKNVSSVVDKRIPPSIVASATALELQASANYHGDNRFKQTGEAQYTGFRTSVLMGMEVLNQYFAGSEFVPSAEIAVTNKADIMNPVTTAAGIDYPFCVPSTRETSMLDNYNLLTSTETTNNSACCFTALGRQDPGHFSMENHRSKDLGVLELRLYRSFAYFQLPHIEEYKTVDGLPYWYDKKTGETFWEHPLADESAADNHRPMLPESPRTHTKATEKRHSSTVGPKRTPASQALMRKHILREPEDLRKAGQLESDPERKAEDELAAAKADSRARLFRDRIGQANVIKGKEPIGSALASQPPIVLDDTLDDSSRQQPHLSTRSAKSKQSTQLPPVSTRPITPALKSPGSQGTSKSTRASTPSVQWKGHDSRIGDERQPESILNQELLSSLSSALETAMAKSHASTAIAGDSAKQAMLQLGLGLGLGIGLRQQSSSITSQPATDIQSQGFASECDGGDRPESSSSSYVTEETATTEKVLLVETPRQSEMEPRENEATETPDESCDDSALRHPAAGEGKLWQAVGSTAAKMEGVLFKSSQPLPEGFVGSIQMSHTAKQYTDYLPTQPNINEPTSVGIVKPVRILNEWTASGFDPWSNGKDPVSTSFVPTLYADEEADGAVPVGTAGAGAADSGSGTKALSSIEQKKLEQAELQKAQEDLDRVFSYCRHGKYEEINAFFEDPDTTLLIDAKDSLGNTLLSIAAQNGNKRIAKLCLRRGADVNTQNLSGQGVLHYCIAYGFEDLADYFIQKGADDTMVNADGLTCYEGLNLDDVNNI